MSIVDCLSLGAGYLDGANGMQDDTQVGPPTVDALHNESNVERTDTDTLSNITTEDITDAAGGSDLSGYHASLGYDFNEIFSENSASAMTWSSIFDEYLINEEYYRDDLNLKFDALRTFMDDVEADLSSSDDGSSASLPDLDFNGIFGYVDDIPDEPRLIETGMLDAALPRPIRTDDISLSRSSTRRIPEIMVTSPSGIVREPFIDSPTDEIFASFFLSVLGCQLTGHEDY